MSVWGDYPAYSRINSETHQLRHNVRKLWHLWNFIHCGPVDSVTYTCLFEFSLFGIVRNGVLWLIGWVGLGCAMAQWCITPCSEVYSLAPTFARSSKALRSSRVIPANNPFHSCKYSTGTSRTIWYGHNCYCQFKERASIPTIFDWFVLIYDKYNIYNIPQPPEQWSVHNLVTRQRSIQ